MGPEQAARLAGVLVVVDNPEVQAVDSLSKMQAIRLVEHYGTEVEKCHKAAWRVVPD